MKIQLKAGGEDVTSDDEGSRYAPGTRQAAEGLIEGPERLMDDAARSMLRSARPVTRFVMKRIPGLPALVLDATEIAGAPNKTRAAFGVAGSLVGAAGGGALGAAAGGVNAPIGAALGSAFGEGVGERIYDDHAAAIDHAVDEARREIGDPVLHGFQATARWIAERNRQVAGRQ